MAGSTRIMTTSANEERWNMPDDECWSNTAASDVSAAAHLKQTKKSWFLSTPPISIDTSKKSIHSKQDKRNSEQVLVGHLPASRLAPYLNGARSTPTTQASTPDKIEPLPESYVEMITNAFGPKADLYRDVLGVSRDASSRTVRIAYFRRGREVLSERTQSPSHPHIPASATISGHISDLARLRFQAVSMAYEIISNPEWLDTYERCIVMTDSDEEDDKEIGTPDVLSDPSISSTRSLASASMLRRAESDESLPSRKTHTGVRWNEEVEELVFNQHPMERKSNKKKKKKLKKKKKKLIALETDVELEKHLEQLDKEAEQNFVHDFLDDLERSIDQLLSFGGDEDEEDLQAAINVSRRLFPEMEDELVPEELSTPKSTKKQDMPSTPKKKHSSRKLDASDIDDEDFHIYDKDRKHQTRSTRNPLEDDDDTTESDARQEHTGGSQPFEATLREEYEENNEADDEAESYISFPKHNLEPGTEPGFPVSNLPRRSDEACLSPKRSHHSQERKSAWHPSPHSPKQSEAGNFAMTPHGANGNTLPSTQSEPTSPRVQPILKNINPGNGSTKKNSLVGALGTADELMQSPPSPKSPKSSVRRKTRARQITNERMYFQALDDIVVTKNHKRSDDDCESATCTIDDSLSTLSASVVQCHVNRDLTDSRYKKAIAMDKAQQQMEELQQKELVSELNTMNGVDASNVQPNQTSSAATTTEFVEVTPNTSAEIDPSDLFCFGVCGDEDLSETARAAAIAQGEDDDPSFTAFFMVYLNAMAADLARLGHCIHENLPTFGFLQISENDLDSVLTILESEMEEMPDEIVKTLSQEFIPAGNKGSTVNSKNAM